MKLFGGFHGAREKSASQKRNPTLNPEEQELRSEESFPEAAAPEMTEATQVYAETAEAASAAQNAESEASDTPKRTPEELAQIEEIIAEYQKKKKRRRWIALGIVAVLAVLGVVLWRTTVKPPDVVQPTGKPNHTASPSANPDRTDSEDPTVTPGDGESIETTPEPERQRRTSVHTFLLVGREQSFGNTDTLMVGIYDEETKTVNVVSIPRDTCANVDSDPKKNELKKINSVFARAEMDGLKDAISDIVGFPIDCYVSIGINGFINLVNTIGGVSFNVPHYMNYDDPTQDLHIHFSPGEQYLNGYDAIKVVRWRQNNDGTNYGDIDRINTQQNFLKTVIKQCLSWSNLKNNLDDYVDIFREYVKTDLSTGNMIWYAQEFLKLDMDNIHFYTLPSNYTDNIRGFSYGTILVDEWLEMLQEVFPVYDQPITLDDLDLITRDENGNLYATSGEIRGGDDSFLDYRDYLKSLNAWLSSQKSSNDTAEAAVESGESGNAADASVSENSDSSSEAAPVGEVTPTEETTAGDNTATETEEAPAPEPENETNGE